MFLVRPCIQHGDFARWNIKVHPSGSWTVLDWERGQLEGIPAWDWFHYYLQSAILVEKLSGDALIERAEAILQTNDFENYAEQSRIKAIARPLMIAYLLHLVHVIQPSEGREAADWLARTIKFT